MNSRLKVRVPASMVSVALGIALLMAAPLAQAQAPSRFVGTITAISADALTVKTDAGQV